MSKKYIQSRTPKSTKYQTPKLVRDATDSDESTKSTSSDTAGSYNSDDISLIAEFDDLMRLVKQQRFIDVEDKFFEFVEQVRNITVHSYESTKECKRLQFELAKVTHDYSELECKLGHARKLLDQEKKRSRKIEDDRNALDHKINNAAHVLFNKQNRIPDHVLKELAFLHNENFDCGGIVPQLSAIQEVNTTGSLISDFSYSRSEDDLDTSAAFCNKFTSTMKSPNKRSSEFVTQPAVKKRRSTNSKVVEINAADTVRATTTLTVSKDGPITATSVIESVPPESSKVQNNYQPSAPPAHLVVNTWGNNNNHTNNKVNLRQHSFQNKILVIPETCGPCNKRIRFGRTVFKCTECRALCHLECKDLLPLPCIPLVNTPQKGISGTISDYTPSSSPMVPALIVHCTKEIENRGCKELGIYRIPGSEKEVKSLKERFLKGKGAPSISQTDVHVICGTVKDFLRFLQEPLVTYSRRPDFVKAVEMSDKNDIAPVLSQIVSELPQPNRDTLAYMILHLKRVGNMPDCKMPIENLAKIFAPTIVGYSSSECHPSAMLTETGHQLMIMEHLVKLPAEFWESFLTCNSIYKTPTGKLQQTPSTDSLLYPKSRGIFSPYSVKSSTKRKQKFFPSPDGML